MSGRRQASEDFSHSITDLMTSIAVIFILLFLFFAQQQRQETEEKVNETEQLQQELLKELKNKFGPLKIDVSPRDGDPLTIEVTLPEKYRGSLTFRRNESMLLPKGRELIGEVMPLLLGIVCQPRFRPRIDSVVVEGHSSSEGKEHWNVELSARRATAVLLHSLSLVEESESRECLQDLASASGRGPWHPKLDENEEEDRAASRRVVFRLRVKSFEQRQESNALASDLGSEEVQNVEAAIFTELADERR
ncbi:MAG: OmpA/MotB family protein [Myxococcota bacterium]